jgi:hypothetical protein
VRDARLGGGRSMLPTIVIGRVDATLKVNTIGQQEELTIP